MGASGSGSITIRDAEVVALAGDSYIEFNCTDGDLPRLMRHASAYERFRVISLTVEYVPLVGAATTGSVYVAICPGPKRNEIKDRASVVKVQPLLMTPGWKAGRLVAGRNIDAQRFMHVGKTDADGVAFTIYAFPSAKDLGALKVTYAVQLAFPVPF